MRLTVEEVKEILFFLISQLEGNLSYTDLYTGLDRNTAMKVSAMKKHTKEGYELSNLEITGGTLMG